MSRLSRSPGPVEPRGGPVGARRRGLRSCPEPCRMPCRGGPGAPGPGPGWCVRCSVPRVVGAAGRAGWAGARWERREPGRCPPHCPGGGPHGGGSKVVAFSRPSCVDLTTESSRVDLVGIKPTRERAGSLASRQSRLPISFLDGPNREAPPLRAPVRQHHRQHQSGNLHRKRVRR